MDRHLDLARRAVMATHWRWMAGMMARGAGQAWRVVQVSPRLDLATVHNPDRGLCVVVTCRLPPPDLDDPATLGCLEYLVLQVHGGREFIARAPLAPDMSGRDRWHWHVGDHRGHLIVPRQAAWVVQGQDGRVACLVAALEWVG